MVTCWVSGTVQRFPRPHYTSQHLQEDCMRKYTKFSRWLPRVFLQFIIQSEGYNTKVGIILSKQAVGQNADWTGSRLCPMIYLVIREALSRLSAIIQSVLGCYQNSSVVRQKIQETWALGEQASMNYVNFDDSTIWGWWRITYRWHYLGQCLNLLAKG